MKWLIMVCEDEVGDGERMARIEVRSSACTSRFAMDALCLLCAVL